MTDLWTAVACLKPKTSTKGFRLFKGKGAYVNVVAWAESGTCFEQKVRHHLEALGCVLLELEGVQTLESKMANSDYPEELFTMRDTANRQREDSIFGTFHIWQQEDAN